ncbi:hypothetical protein KXD93_12165 [Mucilaginibacter sp. BJC16-A38]|uniref:hypothetical protein n=1 Tax=Mucilaginibacter phenanthrenivorans TaxID=1234842 RepID=UPI0021572A33|nr:hypothetical protein [Mucilaginibacter phenanthrenivorans]MCR8558405.1 hypothetical protein [Mucilaginibacter phenanthrenivorans]
MKKPSQEAIPRTIIKNNSGSIYAAFLERGGKILFLNPKCVVTGIGDLVELLFTTPEFTTALLPPNVAASIHEVKGIVLQVTFSSGVKLKKNYPIPLWLSDFKKVEHLKLVNADLDNLSDITDLPVQHLILGDVSFSDADNLVAAIKQFKQLRYLAYDESFPLQVVEALAKLNSGVTLLTVSEYIAKGLFGAE